MVFAGLLPGGPTAFEYTHCFLGAADYLEFFKKFDREEGNLLNFFHFARINFQVFQVLGIDFIFPRLKFKYLQGQAVEIIP